MINHTTPNHPRNGVRWRASLLLALAVACVLPAQTTNDNDSKDEKVVSLGKYEVTGSYIPVSAEASTIPVQTITADDIAKTGVATNVLDVLRKAMPMFSGNANLGDTNANISSGATGGGSQVAFRNTQTLVLINGRRAAYAPVLASGGNQFVDVNLIPMSAIERIDVLADGASATYGSDAVAGVVNIILKKNFEGFEVGAHYGMSEHSDHYSERSAYVIGGAGNGKTSLTLSASWSKTDPLFQYERNFSNPSYGTGTFAGVISSGSNFYVLNPSLNAPPTNTDLTLAQLVANGTYLGPFSSTDLINGTGAAGAYSFNLANYVTLLLRNERSAVTAALDHQINDRVSLFGDLLYTHTETFSQLNAQPFSASVAASNAYNPANVAVTARNRLVEYPRQYFYDTTSIRGSFGARGSIDENTNWEMAANYNRVAQDYTNKNLISTAARQAAVASGLINLFARTQADGAIEESGILGTALGSAVSKLVTYDARVNGHLFALPAGDVQYAFGGDIRRESLSQTADRNSQTATFGWDSATTLDPFEADRNVKSLFAELRVPLVSKESAIPGIHTLDLDIAARHEIYSDTDDPTVPKFALRWQPFSENLTLRATYGESFAAPTLFQLFGPGSVGFTSTLNLTSLSGGAITGQANARTGSNSALLPSTSKNFTAGFVWSPKTLKGFSVSVDYFHIEQKDLISSIGSATILQSVELLGAASPYAKFVRIGAAGDTSMFDGGTAITAAGQISGNSIDSIYVTDTLVNIAGQKLDGFDVKLEDSFEWRDLGRFKASSTIGIYNHYRIKNLPDSEWFETVGYATNSNGTIPKFSAYTTLDWTRGNWGANLGWRYIPHVTDVNGDDTAGDVTADTYVEAYHSIDTAVRYTFGNEWRYLKGLTLTAGVNNVFDESPPSAAGTFTESNADIATYGAVGRMFYLDFKYRF
ncbi:MAG: TonB-dependent receptor [Opitutae bacterium]|nr:TonB-dependent receptor [Opitutae bacterium]